MLIRVLPRSSGDSSIMFHLSLPNLPASLPNPASWEQQLSTLLADDLLVPDSLYALDKSAVFPALLEEVSFNLPLGIVCCRFVDLSMERWPITRSCMLSLDAVLEHLAKSMNEVPQESSPAQGSESGRKQAKRLSLQSFQTTMHKITGRHNKPRSLFKSWMSSIVNPRIFWLSLISRTKHASVEPTKTPTRGTVDPPLTSHEHRLMARSTLLDTFRRHVLPELKNRVSFSGYYTWIVQSMLRRVSQRLDEIKICIGTENMQLYPVHHMPSNFTTDEDVPPSPISSLGQSDSTRIGDTSSSETDEDSLLPTPSSSKFEADPLVHIVQDNDTQDSCPHRTDDACPVSKDMAEFNHCVATAARLRDLFNQAESNNRHIEHERQHRESILEMRSRRRAWLNRSLVGGLALERNRTLSQPYEKSPLHHARYSWDEDSDDDSADSYPLLMETKLFPVTEEEEDDDCLLDGFPGMVHSMFSNRGRPRAGSAFGAHTNSTPTIRLSQADVSFASDTDADAQHSCPKATPEVVYS